MNLKMKKYKVIIEPKAQKQIKKINYMHAKIINKWIKNNLVDCTNPYFIGKSLKGDLKNLWRYRVGNYIILANIDNDKIIIKVIKTAYRKDVYTL